MENGSWNFAGLSILGISGKRPRSTYGNATKSTGSSISNMVRTMWRLCSKKSFHNSKRNLFRLVDPMTLLRTIACYCGDSSFRLYSSSVNIHNKRRLAYRLKRTTIKTCNFYTECKVNSIETRSPVARRIESSEKRVPIANLHRPEICISRPEISPQKIH